MIRRPPRSTPFPTRRSSDLEPGDDRKLADWPTLVRYYQALASASDRMRYRELGHSTLGAPMIALVISSPQDRKSTRLNSSHGYISYAVFCLKKKKTRHSR